MTTRNETMSTIWGIIMNVLFFAAWFLLLHVSLTIGIVVTMLVVIFTTVNYLHLIWEYQYPARMAGWCDIIHDFVCMALNILAILILIGIGQQFVAVCVIVATATSILYRIKTYEKGWK